MCGIKQTHGHRQTTVRWLTEGKGFSGTTIKHTWTKPRVRVEAGEGDVFCWGGVERWGENADKCN